MALALNKGMKNARDRWAEKPAPGIETAFEMDRPAISYDPELLRLAFDSDGEIL